MTPKAKNLLRVLADRADKEGRSFARQTTLAEDLGVSERTIRDALKELEAMCWIERERRFRRDGSRTSDLITVRDLETAAKHAEAMLRLPLMVAITGGQAVDKSGDQATPNRQNLPVVQPAKSAGYRYEPTTSKESSNLSPDGEAARRLRAAASPERSDESQADMAARLRALADELASRRKAG